MVIDDELAIRRFLRAGLGGQGLHASSRSAPVRTASPRWPCAPPDLRSSRPGSYRHRWPRGRAAGREWSARCRSSCSAAAASERQGARARCRRRRLRHQAVLDAASCSRGCGRRSGGRRARGRGGEDGRGGVREAAASISATPVTLAGERRSRSPRSSTAPHHARPARRPRPHARGCSCARVWGPSPHRAITTICASIWRSSGRSSRRPGATAAAAHRDRRGLPPARVVAPDAAGR